LIAHDKTTNSHKLNPVRTRNAILFCKPHSLTLPISAAKYECNCFGKPSVTI